MRLVAAVVMLWALDADARGIFFNVYGDHPVVAETTKITRCPREIEEDKSKHGALVTCRPVKDRYLAGRQSGKGVDLELVTKSGDVAWRRHLDGTVAFATDTLLVFQAGTGYRAVWLAEADGKTVAEVVFASVPDEKLPSPCGDRILGVYRTNESTSRLAAVCLVLD